MKYSLSRFSVGSNHVKAARQALEKLVAAIHKNDPDLVYLVFQEADQPVFFTLVSFENEESFRRHATSPHVAGFARTILPMCDGKPCFVGLDLISAARTAKSAKNPSKAGSRPGTRARKGVRLVPAGRAQP
jgi:quinol monooxygenase YgiN